MADRPYIHCLSYGSPGEGKSHFFATFPKPMLVISFDPMGKNQPYFKRGTLAPTTEGEYGQEVWSVMSKKNPENRIVSVEVWGGDAFGQAYQSFHTNRMREIHDEVRSGEWASVILDTLTGAELGARRMYTEILKPKDSNKEWSIGTTDSLESLCLSLLSLRCNVGVAAHVDKDKDEVLGRMVGTYSAPGRLQKKDGLAARFPEVYRLHSVRDGDTIRRFLQTRTDQRYLATSVFLEAPDPCEPDYSALWENYQG